MRNRIRSRGGKGKTMAGEDVPLLMRFCGIGMLFGDAAGEDNDALNSRKVADAEKVRVKDEKDASKRRFRMRKKKEDQLEEAIEVVDNIDLDGEK
jgi:hypothetical protein